MDCAKIIELGHFGQFLCQIKRDRNTRKKQNTFRGREGATVVTGGYGLYRTVTGVTSDLMSEMLTAGNLVLQTRT